MRRFLFSLGFVLLSFLLIGATTTLVSNGGSFLTLTSTTATFGSSLLVNNGKTGFSPEGGLLVKLTNKTGSASVKGNLVTSHATIDDAFILSPADSYLTFGVVYESGVADGSECWIVTSGITEILLKDATASAPGSWAGVSDVDGRAYANWAPPSGDAHAKGVGVCIDTKEAGTGVLMKTILGLGR